MVDIADLFGGGGGGGGFTTSIDRIASGAITLGDTVAANTDGTVSKILMDSYVAAAGAPQTIDAGSFSAHVSVFYDPSSDTYLACSVVGGNLTAWVGTLSGTTMTWGSPQVIGANAATDIMGCYDSTNQKIILFYKDGSFLYTNVCSISGTTLTVGAKTLVYTGYSIHFDVCHHSGEGRIVYLYTNAANYPTARAGTISGTTVTLGTEQVLVASGFPGAGLAYVPEKDLLVFSVYESTTPYVRTYTATLSGDTFTASTTPFNYVGDAADTSSHPRLRYNPATGAVCAASGKSSAVAFWDVVSQTKIVRGNIASGPTIKVNDKAPMDVDPATGLMFMADETSGTNGLWYWAPGKSRSVFSNAIMVYTTQPYNPIWPATQEINFHSGNAYYCDVTRTGDPGKALIVFSDASDTSKLKSAVVQMQCSLSNAHAYVGIASATVADGETVNVLLPGSIATGLSGLNAGTEYYLAKDGSFTTDFTSSEFGITVNDSTTVHGRYYAYIGRAISQTEMQLLPNKTLVPWWDQGRVG